MRTFGSFLHKTLLDKVVRIDNPFFKDPLDPKLIQIKIKDVKFEEFDEESDDKYIISNLPNGDEIKYTIRYDSHFEILPYKDIDDNSKNFLEEYSKRKNRPIVNIQTNPNIKNIDSVLSDLDD